jgi:hypothetical protein
VHEAESTAPATGLGQGPCPRAIRDVGAWDGGAQSFGGSRRPQRGRQGWLPVPRGPHRTRLPASPAAAAR